MSQSADPRFHLSWKGANTGPFTLAQIREKLTAGEVSRMHLVQVDGRWLSVDEFVAGHEASERQAAIAREARLRQEYEDRLASERAEAQSLARKLEATERRTRLLPAEAAAPPPVPQTTPEVTTKQRSSRHGEEILSIEASRTSGYAITAFICSLCNFVPFLNFVSWILALVFGHVALRDIHGDPSLAGRGLAIAALCITYFLLVLGLTFGVLMALNGWPGQ